MKKIAIIFSLLLSMFAVNITAHATSKPYPLEYFAVRDAISNVQVSPDGKYLAFMEINSKKGNPTIVVYETADLSKKPFRAGGDKLQIRQFSWVGDKDMVVVFEGRIRKRVKGFNDGVFRSKLANLNVETKKFNEYKEAGLGFESGLVDKPNKILVSYREGVKDGRAVEGKAVRAISYYEYDLQKKSKKLVLKGNSKYGRINFDAYGNPRVATGFDGPSREFVTYYRQPGEGSWKEIFRKSENDFENFAIAGFIKDDPTNVYVIAHNGNDKQGLWKYNTSTKSFGELVYRRKDVDVRGIRVHSNQFTNPDEVVGVAYSKEKLTIKYFDKVEEATFRQLEGLVPNAYNLRIITRSNDGNVFVVRNSGPKDGGSFYLYNNGKFNLVGKRKGLLKAEDLADVEYIEYTARDGRTIPAYVTKPKGTGPFPLVVMPHGGPFVAETVSFDEWGQLLANNGYMVLQPQYRGSRGRGLDHYQTAFINGGQGGFKMQDDKDDGAKHLIAQGKVQKDRVAMFGWSYGGYAALVAAARSPQIYQCVVAGAAVADNNQQVNYYRSRIEGTGKIEQLSMWDDSISPVKEAAKVNVPLLIVHGDVDQRVPFKHHQKFTSALDKNNVPYQELVLKDADHFSSSLTYDHKITFYTKLIDYLNNDCGAGGL